MTCGWWPSDQKRRCGRIAEWKMIDGDLILGGLCLKHKKEAQPIFPSLVFRKMRADLRRRLVKI